ncbi:MAG TPA: sn-glycerol-3-phosphate ABC transporter ATP-binding protein UgpC [Candidatus Udaeobacter sp.]|nr:sn-glycerol-3-phosphate ABC transporter ATP-binding protein UgpC [Candidatus Udaeobacter sp.]
MTGKIVLKGVRKAFGEHVIIPSIDLEINEGEFVVFVGPSGCGKSTLLRLIAGLEDATAGKIEIDSVDISDVPPARRGLSMVFQSYALYPHMSVRGNIGFGLRMAGESKEVIRQKVEKAAAVLNLTAYLDRKPRQLSGGQRQRVAIGRAIVREPKAFLFDEPLSNLDAALRVQMRLEIAQLHESLSTTMIYVTHDQVEAMTLADKIVVLNSGTIEQVGTPLELYHHPVNLFVAGFIGSPKMNFFETEVVAAGSDGVTVALPGGQAVTVPVLPDGAAPGGKVTLGVRPEHLRPAEAGELAGDVVVVERLGGDTFLYLRLPGQPLVVAQAEGSDPTRVRDHVHVRIDPATCHLFDAKGRSLPHRQRHALVQSFRPTDQAAKHWP